MRDSGLSGLRRFGTTAAASLESGSTSTAVGVATPTGGRRIEILRRALPNGTGTTILYTLPGRRDGAGMRF